MMGKRAALTVLLLAAFAALSSGQTTVRGRVFDGSTGEPLPYVNLSFSATGTGTTTRIDGTYEISTNERPGRLEVSFIGYAPQSIDINRGITTRLDIALEPREILLSAAEVRPDKDAENPAVPLFKRIRDAKPRNDPAGVPASRAEVSFIPICFSTSSKSQINCFSVCSGQAA